MGTEWTIEFRGMARAAGMKARMVRAGRRRGQGEGCVTGVADMSWGWSEGDWKAEEAHSYGDFTLTGAACAVF